MLIAFTGKIGSGKDAAGERTEILVGIDTVRLSFAAPLKESAAALLDIPVQDWEIYKNDPEVKIVLVDGYSANPLFVVTLNDDGTTDNIEVQEPNVIREFTAREFLQRYGTESHRDVFGENFWTDQAMQNYYRSADTLFYFTDCRFPNEADAVKAAGGHIVRVLGANEETGRHVSEAGLPEGYIDFEIDNSHRDDSFAALDEGLSSLLSFLSVPLATAVTAS